MTNIRAIALLGCLALGLAACSSNVSSTATNATTVSTPVCMFCNVLNQFCLVHKEPLVDES